MNPTELTIFGAFLALQVAIHRCEDLAEHPIVRKLRSEPRTAWLVHHTVLESVRDYGVHFIIYSGYVIGSH